MTVVEFVDCVELDSSAKQAVAESATAEQSTAAEIVLKVLDIVSSPK